MDDEAVHLVGAGRVLVAPRHVVAGARGEDLDLRMPVEALRDVSRVELRPAVEIGAVALNDDRESHRAVGSPGSGAPLRAPLASDCVSAVTSAAPSRVTEPAGDSGPRPPPPTGSGPQAPSAGRSASVATTSSARPDCLRRFGARAATPAPTTSLPLLRTRRIVALAVPVTVLRRRDLRPVLHHALERPGAALVEVEPARDRLHPHLVVLHVDREARHLHHEVVQQLVGESIELGPRLQLRRDLLGPLHHPVDLRVDLLLGVECMDDGSRVEEELQHRPQHPADAVQDSPEKPARRTVDGVAVELEQRGAGWHVARFFRDLRGAPAVVVEQIRADVLGVEELLELYGGQLPDLLLGIVDAALLADPSPDLLHELLDVDRLRTNVELGHRVAQAPGQRR